ncbi:hypothetical protein LEP1GSC005_3849 [Leptospira santarosai str. ST188]|uniref:Uncharacterized protein n=2 Tax=Leptospira santarosai TaxID=28183 RepID=M6JEI5_9LEPT|nr:hypothetical protein LEP1GSC005_3849 [Leptospira santarosai str. ST188]EMM87945.1 hypothetical protein LEP1GSC039_2645 [Leptospira santarosai str. 2000027870]EMN20394.1 hypothetical protein LEP1GSC063_4261 [Leptospira santarosai serovar Arenal str. MAVJ 401]EMO21647.1 hypothetical protein LEP1GSC168_1505 [Leptospira santarosai str. HAI134]
MIFLTSNEFSKLLAIRTDAQFSVVVTDLYKINYLNVYHKTPFHLSSIESNAKAIVAEIPKELKQKRGREPFLAVKFASDSPKFSFSKFK